MNERLLNSMATARVPMKRIGTHTLDLPRYETDGAAAMDLRLCIHDREHGVIWIHPSRRLLANTGFAMAIPQGLELQIRPRSGLANQKMLTVLNSPGTIDSDYRGEIKVLLVNHSREIVRLEHGDRIAQAVLAPVIRAVPWEVDELPGTARGEGGFGHTGRN